MLGWRSGQCTGKMAVLSQFTYYWTESHYDIRWKAAVGIHSYSHSSIPIPILLFSLLFAFPTYSHCHSHSRGNPMGSQLFPFPCTSLPRMLFLESVIENILEPKWSKMMTFSFYKRPSWWYNSVTPPTAKRWLSVVRCVRQQSVYFVKCFITNNTKSSQRNDNTVAKLTQNIRILKALLQSKFRTHEEPSNV